MKFVLGIALVCFCGAFMFNNAKQAPEDLSAVEVDPSTNLCVCFEWYFNNLEKKDRTIYQTCDNTILDFNADDITLATFTLDCDSLIDGIVMKEAILWSPRYHIPDDVAHQVQ